MAHGPASEWGVDHAARYKGRLGILLFAIYTALYVAFVLINVLAPSVMDTAIGGINLATAYGMGLIVVALILGVIYNKLSTDAETRLTAAAESQAAPEVQPQASKEDAQ